MGSGHCTWHGWGPTTQLHLPHSPWRSGTWQPQAGGKKGSLGQLETELPLLTLATCPLRSRTSFSRFLFSPRAVESAASLEFSKASTSLRRAWAVSRSPSFLAFLQGKGWHR